MKSAAVKDKHLKLDQTKIKKAQAILRVRTETETVEKALDLVISTNTMSVRRNDVLRSIISRRDRLKAVQGNVADWVQEGRAERDKVYGG
jgi:hypothetical protein